MDKLKQKSSIVFELLFSQETRQTYGKALTLTWNILKETVLLFWLLFCSIFLVFFWGGNYIKQASQNVKTWYTDLDEEQQKNVVKTAFDTFQGSIGFSLDSSVEMAKTQLGIESDPPSLPAIPPAPAIAPKPEAEAVTEEIEEETVEAIEQIASAIATEEEEEETKTTTL